MKFQLFVLILCLIALSQQNRQKPKPDFNWNPVPVHRPENQCKPFTTIVETVVTADFKLICNSNSKLRQISQHSSGMYKITCNDVIVHTNDIQYDVIISGDHGSISSKTITITNNSDILSWNNGNFVVQQEGIIAGGKCSGDRLWGTALFQANDQIACCKDGITLLTALKRQIKVNGKCASSCSLGSSTLALAQPVSNVGLVDWH